MMDWTGANGCKSDFGFRPGVRHDVVGLTTRNGEP